MELKQVMENRRSIRAFDGDKKITREQLEELLAAGNLAPSWKNMQATRYYCILSKEKMQEFRDACFEPWNHKNTKDAAALIVVCYEKNIVGFAPDHVTPDNELGNGWGIYDAGLQSQNILLKAYDMGLGTLVMGLRNSDEIRKFFDIPESQDITAVISVGYPVEAPDAKPRKSVAEMATIV